MKKELYLLATDKIHGAIPSIVKLILFFLSLIYGACIRLILFCYKKNVLKTHKLNCKVISIGNITLGGTGKTPLVEFLTGHLKQEGYRVGILSRGYKRDIKTKTKSTYKSIGDEPYMLTLNNPDIPIGVGENRINKGREIASKYNLDMVLLDDGFQHWRLYRDLDIITIDASYPFGNKCLIPRGILREPLSSLKRADIFMITKSDTRDINLERIKAQLRNINPTAILAESVFKPVYFYNIDQLEAKGEKQAILPNAIEDKNIGLLCSIANPAYFHQMIINLGLNPALKFYFMDHYEYKQQDLGVLFHYCSKKNIKTIITTEKDAVKLRELIIPSKGNYRILVLKIEFKITQNEKEFFNRLSTVYKH